MDFVNFQKFVSLLNIHSIFQNNSNHLQVSVELQIANFLKRISFKKNIFRLYSRFEIAERMFIYIIKE